MKTYILAAAITVGLMIQGCGSVVLPTVATLNAMSPLEADPAGFEIAIVMPEGADVQKDGALIQFDMARSDTGETVSEEYALQRRTSSDGRVLFRIHPDDLNAVRAFQMKARVWEVAVPEESSGSFSLAVTACKTNVAVSPDATFSVSIRTVVDGPFLPLLRNVSVVEVLENFNANAEDATGTSCG